MKNEINYLADITIDQNALDLEWLDQPSLAFKYAEHASEMRRIVDVAKEDLDLVCAELDREIRKNPNDFEIEKVTETLVSNTIKMQEQYKEANNKYIEANYEYRVAMAAVEAINQKKASLENLVKLNGQAYFASPSVPRDIDKEWEQREKTKRSNQRIAEKILKK